MNHENDGDTLGGGAEEEDPHGEGISYQIECSDHQVNDRNGNAGVFIPKQGKGGIVKLGVAGIHSHDQTRPTSPPMLCQRFETCGRRQIKNNHENPHLCM